MAHWGHVALPRGRCSRRGDDASTAPSPSQYTAMQLASSPASWTHIHNDRLK